MYIVAIAWIYVVGVMAASADSVIGGVMAFAFGGLLPLAIIAALFRPRRSSDEPVDDEAGDHDRADAQRDQ